MCVFIFTLMSFFFAAIRFIMHEAGVADAAPVVS